MQLFYQAAGNVCNNGCHDKLDEGKVQEMVTGMLGDVSAASKPEVTYALSSVVEACSYTPRGALRVATVVQQSEYGINPRVRSISSIHCRQMFFCDSCYIHAAQILVSKLWKWAYIYILIR